MSDSFEDWYYGITEVPVHSEGIARRAWNAAILSQQTENESLKTRMKLLEGLLREAQPILRGRHSKFTYGPKDLVERVEAILTK
jgi:hypothetical protein